MPNDMDCRAERKRPIATVLPITSGSMSKSMRVRGIRGENHDERVAPAAHRECDRAMCAAKLPASIVRPHWFRHWHVAFAPR